jgi:hypothetical protein
VIGDDIGLDCCTTGAAVVALAQSIRSFARRARVGELGETIHNSNCGCGLSSSGCDALTELVTMAKESNR